MLPAAFQPVLVDILERQIRVESAIKSVVAWAEANGQLEPLIRAAYRVNPRDPALLQFLQATPDAPPTSLTAPMRKQLHAALVHAYPRIDDLALMVRLELGIPLPEIVTVEDVSLRVAVFYLIDWIESRGLLPELIRAASTDNPTPELVDLAQQLGLS